MYIFVAVVLAAAVAAAPVESRSLPDTHHKRWTPSGKVPAVTYHPKKKRSCDGKASPIHLAGKTHLPVKQGCERK